MSKPPKTLPPSKVFPFLNIPELKVGAILSCAKGYMVSHPTSLVQHYKYIPGEDKETFNISLHFDECVEFIR